MPSHTNTATASARPEQTLGTVRPEKGPGPGPAGDPGPQPTLLCFYWAQNGQNPDSIQIVDKIDTSLLCIKLVLKELWFSPIIHDNS